MKRIRIWALLLALTMLLGTPVRASEPVLPQQEHLELSMAELETCHFDLEAFRSLCGDIQAQCTDRDNLEAVEALVQELRRDYLLMDTELTLCSLNISKHAADAAAQEVYLDKLEQSYEVDALMSQTVVAVAASACIRAIDQQDPVFYSFLWESSPTSQEEQQLYLEEQALVNQYYSASQGTFTAQAGGLRCTEAEAYEAYLSGDLTWEQYDQAALEIAMAQNAALADTYVALVENRTRQAALYDCEDYALMADVFTYGRDYTRGEIAAFSQAVKTYIVPLTLALEAKMQDYASRGGYDASYAVSYDTEELLDMLRRGLAGISEELLPAADYMAEYGYYDIDPAPDKAEGAYTTYLAYPNAPYLLMQPEGGPWDLSTLVHEFGHYNAYFCSNDVYAANYDLSEIHSQGLELLMTHEYPALFGDAAGAMELDTMYALLTSLVDGCMMDELERYAYTQADLTVEQLNRKYMELLKDYGYRDPEDPAEEAYSWVLTAHLYSNPLYYISYAVSAAGAFALWEQSLTDWDGAVDAYLRLVALGESDDFFPTLRQVGLDNPITPASVEALSVLVAQELQLDYDTAAAETIQKSAQTLKEQLTGQLSREQPELEALLERAGDFPFRTVLLVGAGLLVTADVAVLAVVLVIRRKEKRTHDKTGN